MNAVEQYLIVRPVNWKASGASGRFKACKTPGARVGSRGLFIEVETVGIAERSMTGGQLVYFRNLHRNRGGDTFGVNRRTTTPAGPTRPNSWRPKLAAGGNYDGHTLSKAGSTFFAVAATVMARIR